MGRCEDELGDDALLGEGLPELHALLEAHDDAGASGASGGGPADSHNPADTVARFGQAASSEQATTDGAWDAAAGASSPSQRWAPRVCLHATRSGVHACMQCNHPVFLVPKTLDSPFHMFACLKSEPEV